jgi:hypothetical protein
MKQEYTQLNKYYSIVLFTDDTSLLITDSNKLDFNTTINQSLYNIISWFNSNLLVLNFKKPTMWNLEQKIIMRLKLKSHTIT